MVPSALSCHCWLAPPVQVQIRILAPDDAVGASRHLFPYTVSCRPAVAVQLWLAPPLQSQICTAVPSAWLCPLTSRQRLEPAPRISPVGVCPDPIGVTDRLSNWAVTPCAVA